MDLLDIKFNRLRELLESAGSVLVAFSAGVDSTFLLKVAHDVLGDAAVAVTASAPFIPVRETDEARAFCRSEGIEHIILEHDGSDVHGFYENVPERCYLCKKALFSRFLEVARERRLRAVIEGSNTDDDGDYRPGMAALAELGIRSPLKEAELCKADIRQLSKRLGLPSYNKPSFACLASRFPYGEAITREKLGMVAAAEQLLFDLGFHQVRVRIHGRIARIEVEPKEFHRFTGAIAKELDSGLRSLGFDFVTLDLGGYKTGSMNQTLPSQIKDKQ